MRTASAGMGRTMAGTDLWGWKGLTIVGTGIRPGLQTTPEAKISIVQATKVLFSVDGLLAEEWLKRLNPSAESLAPYYVAERPRVEIYAAIVERVLTDLRRFRDVCLVFYGHPGVLVGPSHEVTLRARSEGFEVRMLPGVSALDNLFSDLGVDPGVAGLQSYECTGFLRDRPRFDPAVPLVLWQIGVVGQRVWDPQSRPEAGVLRSLRDHLQNFYPPEHAVVLYEAPVAPFAVAKVISGDISDIPEMATSNASTLYIPPLPRPASDHRLPAAMSPRREGSASTPPSSESVSLSYR